MSRLFSAHQANPSAATLAKIEDYARKHPMVWAIYGAELSALGIRA